MADNNHSSIAFKATLNNAYADKFCMDFKADNDVASNSDTYYERVSGQSLAGSGALVFEGELLEFPQWN